MRIASLTQPGQTKNNIAAIILAAGRSERFGSAKILLPWGRHTLLRHIADTILSADVCCLYVVLGNIIHEAQEVLQGLPLELVINKEWHQGQSTSVRAGLHALSKQASAAMFFLGDQPFISRELINGIIQEYQSSDASVVVPRVAGQRTNPVLFDREIFPDLENLEGDTGARAILNRLPVHWFDWKDERLLLDIDRPEDYEKIQRLMADNSLGRKRAAGSE